MITYFTRKARGKINIKFKSYRKIRLFWAFLLTIKSMIKY
jgi:hypothetical protein